MKKYFFVFIFAVVFTTCTKNVNNTKLLENSYLNNTENTKLSKEKIDNKETYEINFNIKKPVECLIIEMEGVYLQRTFPNGNIPKRVYFIVEKELQVPQFQGNDKKYVAIGKNFNNDWEISSPVRMCINQKDAFLALDVTGYRIRFTVFETKPFYYILKIKSESEIIFN